MQDVLKKLTSRKFWMALAGVTTGIAMVFGVDGGSVSTVAGAVTALVSAVAYIVAEGKIDAAAVGSAAEKLQNALDMLRGGEQADKTDETAA